MKRVILPLVALAATAVCAALAYQALARERDYRAWVARGDAALVDDQTFTAIEAYSGAVAERPDAVLAYLRRGETYQHRGDAARGDLEAAARDFRTAAALDPAATRPLEELGDVLFQMQRFARAADSYDRCLRLDDRSAHVAYKLALARYRDGDPVRAVAAATQAIRLNDQLADAYYLVGICERELQQVPDAERALERAVALSPGLIPAREELADVYSALDRRGDEIAQLQLLAALDSSHVERQVELALAQARSGRPDMSDVAVLTLGASIEHTADQPLVYAALGRVWLDRAQTRGDRVALSKALEALERAAAMPGASSEALTLYGRALLQDGEADVAERTLQQATSRYPIDPTAFLFYAQAAEHENHLDNARQALIDYGDLVGDGSDFVARATRIAALSIRMDEADTAVEWLHRALASNPADVTLLAALADAQLRAGDKAAARATIEKGLDKAPSNAALLALSRRVKP